MGPSAELRLVAKNLLSIQKDEKTTKYNANGTVTTSEAKVESSQPTIMLTVETRF
ncbi:hypothetical protein D3C86_2210830 [compost metagenome]